MKAKERVELMDSQTLYKKVGRKYIKVSDPCAYEGLRKGWWLVKISENGTSIRSTIRPNNAELEAAIRDKEDEICGLLMDVCALQPDHDLSEEARRDWEKLMEKHSGEFNRLYYPSFRECAENIVKKILE